MFTALLIAHIGGAILSAIIALYACVLLLVRAHESYRRVAIVLGSLAAFEVLSGTGLAITSASITAVSLCANVALYVLVIATIEALLYSKIHDDVRFPTRAILAPISASLLAFLAALAFGF